MFPAPGHRFHGLSFVLFMASLFAGCGQPAPTVSESALQHTEASWEEQLAAVRAGKASRIQVTRETVSSAQFQQLTDGHENLRQLEIVNAALGATDWELLGNWQTLEWLRLESPVDDAALNEIARLKKLRILNLPAGQFTSAGVKRLADLKQLELLRFSSPEVDDTAFVTISQLPALRFLHVIDVPVTDEGLVPLQTAPALESFYLDGGVATDAGLLRLIAARPNLHLHRDQLHLADDPGGHEHP